jgi:hypothetical protein
LIQIARNFELNCRKFPKPLLAFSRQHRAAMNKSGIGVQQILPRTSTDWQGGRRAPHRQNDKAALVATKQPKPMRPRVSRRMRCRRQDWARSSTRRSRNRLAASPAADKNNASNLNKTNERSLQEYLQTRPRLPP